MQDDLDFASIDVSFISLTKVLATGKGAADGTVDRMVCLIKPQFEAGREKVGKKGVVRDPKVHEEVIHKVIDFALETWILLFIIFPIHRLRGRREILNIWYILRKTARARRRRPLMWRPS